MLSLRARLACYTGLAFAGLVFVLLVLRPAPDPLDNPAFDALSKAHTRRMAADALALDSARAALSHASEHITRDVVRYREIRDTLNIHDTTQVKVFVAQADSVVRSCTDLVEACAVFRVRAESSLAGLTVDRDLYKDLYTASQPSRWAPVREWAIRLGIGYVAFKLGQGVR